MIARIRRGNDFKHVWAINWNGQPEDFSDATDITLTAKVYGQVNTLTEGADYVIDGNLVTIDFTPTICNITGTYNLELNYIKPNNTFLDGNRRSAIDINAFQIVASSDDADTTGDTSSTSDAAIGLPGKSAYQIAVDNGFVGTQAEWLESLIGTDGASGNKIIGVSIVGDDIVYHLDEGKDITMTNGRILLRGEDGVAVSSAAFVDNDLVFTLSDNSSVIIANAKSTLKGDALSFEELTEAQKSELRGAGITSIEQTASSGSEKTYTITYGDSQTTTFTVNDGNDGHTPVISFIGTTVYVDGVAQVDLKGDTGSNIELQKTATHVQWRVVGGSWANLIPLSDLKGEQGDNISMQKTTTHIQWRLGTGAWTNLVALSELKGDAGYTPVIIDNYWYINGVNTGVKALGENGLQTELQKTTTHIQWRVVGGSWANLVALSELKGDTGQGLPSGGLTGQQLVKKSATDYDFEWQTPAGAGDMLKSVYDSDGDGIVDNAEKVNNHTVEEDVPAGAKFTDTIYSHPTSDGNLHVPATGTTNNGKVLKAGATAGSLAWGTDNDTITTINGKTGAITKADIVALGIPAQDTVYTHPAGTNPHGTTKSDVGLGNVDNTSDADKPVSTAQQSAIDSGVAEAETYADGKFALAIPLTQKGAASGVAELDSSGKVLSSQLPSYVDDVLSYTTQSNFPETGESGKIYITEDTNKTYRWTGSAYVEISPSIALGETSATAYRGDRGKIAYDHSQLAHAPTDAQKNSDITKAEIEAKLTGAITTHSHTVTKANVGLGNVDNTSDANKPVSTAQAAAIALKIDASKFQVVEALPASPVTGVFYFIEE